MSKMNLRGLFLLMGALLALGPAVRAQEKPETPLTLDEEYARLAELVPGFGGMYLDERGTTHVYLQDLSLAEKVQGLGEQVEVHQGEYDFRDLYAWKDELRPLLAQRGAAFLDIDEMRNRIVFGVERESLGDFDQELQSLLRNTSIPAQAVVVEEAETYEPVELLTDKIRPVPAGVQISRPIDADTTSVCTLGANATWFGMFGLVTASHCSKTRSVVDGTKFSQNLPSKENQIATEIIDPPFFILGICPSGRLCRRSDALFAFYDSPFLPQQGKIANTIDCPTLSGSLLVDPDKPRLSVSGGLTVNLLPPVGLPIRKVGRTTGCTSGPQKSTCVDTNVSNSPFTMICQNIVSAGGKPGDSGSPVFMMGTKGAILTGILWGVANNTYVYSPWGNVVAELGSLDPTP